MKGFVGTILVGIHVSVLAGLPQGYVKRDGLRFDGRQWMATEYCPAVGDRFECDVTVDEVQPNVSAAVFGTVRELEPERTFAFYVRQDGYDSSVVVYGSTACGGFFPRGKAVSLSVEQDGASWTWGVGDDRLPLTPGSAKNGVTPLMIGDANAARNVNDCVPAGTGAAMALHRFRIWRGGLELIHDYVPCINPAGKHGVYDVVGEKFLPLHPCRAAILAIAVDSRRNAVDVTAAVDPGMTYVLLRSATVAPRSAYTNEVARAKAEGENLTLTDDEPPAGSGFYVVEETRR